MRLKPLFIACYGSLLLIGFAGCKKTVEIDVDDKLAPLSASPPPGGTLKWAAMTPDENFDVIFDQGLCTQKSPLHATYEHPAVCTIAPQHFKDGKQPIVYNFHFQGYVRGKPICSPTHQMYIGPGGCPHCRYY
jgi:hypothetical protein